MFIYLFKESSGFCNSFGLFSTVLFSKEKSARMKGADAFMV